ncbi:MAG TPA: aldo/keto reductase, partial [bacterium]|nr:aldo/keto reductase [bacterium]
MPSAPSPAAPHFASGAAAATPEATLAHAQAMTAQHGFAPWAYRPLGRTDLTVSALGFGGYRVEARSGEQRAALELALRQGVNLIDTSSNYTDGGSEQLIGEVLAGQDIARDRVVVVSKVGYVQGQNLSLARRALEQGKPFPEMVEYQPECWHCIHPEFLRDQLQRSLQRLGLASLDVYLLHNPEYFLMDWAHRHGEGELGAARDAFYRRMQAAFAELERMALAGSIQWYGVSSNSLGQPEQAAEFVSLARVLEAAQAAAAEVQGPGAASRFAVVQCPLNLLESGPALLGNQPGGNQTFL